MYCSSSSFCSGLLDVLEAEKGQMHSTKQEQHELRQQVCHLQGELQREVNHHKDTAERLAEESQRVTQLEQEKLSETQKRIVAARQLQDERNARDRAEHSGKRTLQELETERRRRSEEVIAHKEARQRIEEKLLSVEATQHARDYNNVLKQDTAQRLAEVHELHEKEKTQRISAERNANNARHALAESEAARAVVEQRCQEIILALKAERELQQTDMVARSDARRGAQGALGCLEAERNAWEDAESRVSALLDNLRK